MGLGPPVCEKCHIMAHPLPEKDSRYGANVSLGRASHYCKKCNSIDIKNSLWQYDLEDQSVILGIDDLEKSLEGSVYGRHTVLKTAPPKG